MKSSRTNRREARRLFRLCMVDGRLDEARARAVASRLATSERSRSVPVLWEFLRRVAIDMSRRTAVVESAAELPEDIRHDVTTRLSKSHGEGLNVRFEVKPSLVGGMRIQIGSDVYDGSVRSRLEAIVARL
jgi:F-type H+-transporting ATPase subunit delta